MSRKSSRDGKILLTRSQLTIGEITLATVGVPRFMSLSIFHPCIDGHIADSSEHTSIFLKMSLCSMGMNGRKFSENICSKEKNLSLTA